MKTDFIVPSFEKVWELKLKKWNKFQRSLLQDIVWHTG